jgi:hypothetical protein
MRLIYYYLFVRADRTRTKTILICFKHAFVVVYLGLRNASMEFLIFYGLARLPSDLRW